MGFGQGRVVVNEVMASNSAAHFDEQQEADDWLELRTVSGKKESIGGLFLLVGNEFWQIPEHSSTNADGMAVIWADGQSEQGPLHAPFTLSRNGATILLIDDDGSTLLDAFSYGKQRSDVSFGRSGESLNKAGFYLASTPGKVNSSHFFKSILEAPNTESASGSYQQAFNLKLHAKDGSIRYTLDGSKPSLAHGKTYSEPIRIDSNCVLRAIHFAEGHLQSEELVRTFVFGSGEKFAALVIDPEDLWNDSTGMNVVGRADNFSRRGAAWERPAFFQVIDGEDRAVQLVDLGIAGNGSRALPKRSFAVNGRKRYDSQTLDVPLPTEMGNLKLRADAAGGGHLKERFISALNEKAGGRLDMVPAQPMDLYLNGQYWGLYELMPTKGEEYLGSISNADAFDILTGASGELRKGDRKAYRELLALANNPDLANGVLSDQLHAMVDIDNFIEYWLFEVFTAKVDNAANLRYWRAKQADGRWRWITYDMDLWGDPRENTLARVLDPTDLHEYPLPGLLLKDPMVQQRFINRAADLLNTAFQPRLTTALLDSIFHSMGTAITRDRQRWKSEMNMPTDIAEQMSKALVERPQQLIGHIADQFNVQPVEMDLHASNGGRVLINSIEVSGSKKLIYFQGNVVRLEAIPQPGFQFTGWSGKVQSAESVVYADPSELAKVKAKFVRELGGHSLEDALEEGSAIGVP